jgi:hypothetical protein
MAGVTGDGTDGGARRRLAAAVKRAFSLEQFVSGSREHAASDAFVGRHTKFDSVTAFCAASPAAEDTVWAVERLPEGERDAFVDRTTDFESWAALKRSAAAEDLVALQSP